MRNSSLLNSTLSILDYFSSVPRWYLNSDYIFQSKSQFGTIHTFFLRVQSPITCTIDENCFGPDSKQTTQDFSESVPHLTAIHCYAEGDFFKRMSSQLILIKPSPFFPHRSSLWRVFKRLTNMIVHHITIPSLLSVSCSAKEGSCTGLKWSAVASCALS